MRRTIKRAIAIYLTVQMLVLTLLWGIGFWTPASFRYWRRPAQFALFSLAVVMPRSQKARVTRWALLTHVDGTTYEELEKAARLFESAGDNESASLLWLGLARLDAISSNFEAAELHAMLSQTAAPNERALVAIVVLNINNPDLRDPWINQLQTHYSNSELALVTQCLSQVNSFVVEAPASCKPVGWINEKATASKNKWDDLSNQIRSLPNRRKIEIKKLEEDITKQESDRAENVVELEAIDQEKRDAVVAAGLEAIINLLPLPQPGDTLEKYLVREGLCLLPWVRWICRTVDVGGPVFNAMQRLKAFDEQRALILRLIGYKNDFIHRDLDRIEYWRSSKPLEELQAEKGNVLPAFQNDVRQTISARRESVGMERNEAILSVAR